MLNLSQPSQQNGPKTFKVNLVNCDVVVYGEFPGIFAVVQQARNLNLYFWWSGWFITNSLLHGLFVLFISNDFFLPTIVNNCFLLVYIFCDCFIFFLLLEASGEGAGVSFAQWYGRFGHLWGAVQQNLGRGKPPKLPTRWAQNTSVK